MAELAGLAVAANVMQFVELGVKIVTQFNKLYAAARNGIDAVPDTRAITMDLSLCLNRLEKDSIAEPTDEDSSLLQLSQSCRKIAYELQTKLEAIAPAGKGKREAAQNAVRALWTENDIKDLENRLDGYRNQITMHLVTRIR